MKNSEYFGRILSERFVSCILRWEPVFRGERRKLILDRARLYALYYIVKRGISNDKSKKLT